MVDLGCSNYYGEDIQRLTSIIDSFELFENTKKAPHTQIDFTTFRSHDIPLIIEMSIVSSKGKKFVLKLCEKHFLISNDNSKLFNENIVKSLGISDDQKKFIYNINEKYNESDNKYRELIQDAKNLAKTLDSYDPNLHFTTQSKFNEFNDKYKSIVFGSYKTYSIYPIIYELRNIKFPGIADLMIKIYITTNKQASTHEDKLASLSILMRKIKEIVDNHNSQENRFIFIESINDFIEFIISHKIYEYIKSVDTSSILNDNIRSEIEDLKSNINDYIVKIFTVYIETEAAQRSKGDILRTIEILNYTVNTFTFTDNPKILEFIRKLADRHIDSILVKMIGPMKKK